MLYLYYIQSWLHIQDDMMEVRLCSLANKNILHDYLNFDIGYKDHKVMDCKGQLIQEHLES